MIAATPDGQVTCRYEVAIGGGNEWFFVDRGDGMTEVWSS